MELVIGTCYSDYSSACYEEFIKLLRAVDDVHDIHIVHKGYFIRVYFHTTIAPKVLYNLLLEYKEQARLEKCMLLKVGDTKMQFPELLQKK